MQRRIKLGDKVKLIRDVHHNTITGDELYLKGTIGVVCDDENPNCPCVELKNYQGQDSWTGFSIEDLEIIE